MVEKTFIKHTFEDLIQIQTKHGRVYQPSCNQNITVPSVTTVLSLHMGDILKPWRERVGEEEARQITKRAGLRGTAIHALCEDYLKGKSVVPNMFDQEVFEAMQRQLDKIDNIHCMEQRMMSKILQVAGVTDIIGEYDNVLSVIDYKTSGKPKKLEWCDHHFMQGAAYAVMFWEATGIAVPSITILIGVDGEKEAQVFSQPTQLWVNKFKMLRQEFREIRGF